MGLQHLRASSPISLTCAKQLSSAYLPIAGLLMSDAFYQVLADQSAKFGTLGMGYTYGGHPVAAAVALETLRDLRGGRDARRMCARSRRTSSAA